MFTKLCFWQLDRHQPTGWDADYKQFVISARNWNLICRRKNQVSKVLRSWFVTFWNYVKFSKLASLGAWHCNVYHYHSLLLWLLLLVMYTVLSEVFEVFWIRFIISVIKWEPFQISVKTFNDLNELNLFQFDFLWLLGTKHF